MPFSGHGVYQYGLDSIMRDIVTAGWFNRSDGDVEAPTGHFAQVSIADNELEELVEAVFDHNLYGDIDKSRLVGDFLVIENNLGQVHVYRYPSQVSLVADFVRCQNSYERWHAGMGA